MRNPSIILIDNRWVGGCNFWQYIWRYFQVLPVSLHHMQSGTRLLSSKKGPYKFPQELPNGLRLTISRNWEIWRKSLKYLDLKAIAQPITHNELYDNSTWNFSLKNDFLLRNLSAWFCEFAPILNKIVSPRSKRTEKMCSLQPETIVVEKLKHNQNILHRAERQNEGFKSRFYCFLKLLVRLA